MSAPLLTGCTDTNAKGVPCKGRVWWTHFVYWRGKCDKCSLSTRATAAEALELRLDERAEASRG